MTPSLSGGAHQGADGQGGYSNFDLYTTRGYMAFSPWSQSPYASSIGQLNLAYVPLVKADTLYSGSTVNLSRRQFFYHFGWFTGTTEYLGDQYHITVNQSSSLNSVAFETFQITDAPVTSVSNQSLNSTISASNRAFKSFQNSTTSTPTPTPSQVGNPHERVDEQGGYTYFDIFASRGAHSFSPWVNPLVSHSIGQINLGYIPISKADTLYLGSTVNLSRSQFQSHYPWFNGTSTYLDGLYHLTANYSSAVTSVSGQSFFYSTPPLASVSDPAVIPSTSVPNQAVTSASNRAINSIQNPTTSSANSPTIITPSNSISNLVEILP